MCASIEANCRMILSVLVSLSLYFICYFLLHKSSCSVWVCVYFVGRGPQGRDTTKTIKLKWNTSTLWEYSFSQMKIHDIYGGVGFLHSTAHATVAKYRPTFEREDFRLNEEQNEERKKKSNQTKIEVWVYTSFYLTFFACFGLFWFTQLFFFCTDT